MHGARSPYNLLSIALMSVAFCQASCQVPEINAKACPNVTQLLKFDGFISSAFNLVYPQQECSKLKIVYDYVVPVIQIADSAIALEDHKQIQEHISKSMPIRHKITLHTPQLQLERITMFLNGEMMCSSAPLNFTEVLPKHTIRVEREIEIHANEQENTTTAEVAPAIQATCGISSNVTHLIIGGNLASEGRYPWLALVYYYKNQRMEYECMGNLVTLRHVITVGNCVSASNENKVADPSDVLVVLGLNNLNDFLVKKDSVNAEVEKIFVAPDYVPALADSDLAVIRLRKPVEITNTVRPICLWPEAPKDDSNELGVVAGWGSTDGGSVSDPLREISLPIIPFESCKSRALIRNLLSNRTICAGERNKQGPCSGDGGSGLMVHRDSKFYLQAVFSLTLKNGSAGYCGLSEYGIYTDVTKHKDWIIKQLEEVPTETEDTIADIALNLALEKILNTTVDDECGIPGDIPQLSKNFTTNIAPYGKYPWLVAMYTKSTYQWTYKCTGNLISVKHVLTAAFCLEYKDDKRLKLVPTERMLFAVGLLDLQLMGRQKGAQYSGAENVQIHPHYRQGRKDANIAIVTLKENIQFSLLARPLCIWPFELSSTIDSLVDERGVVVGWNINEYIEASNEPTHVPMSIISNDVCKAEDALFPYITARTFCAGEKLNEDVCSQDSGSGIYIKRHSKYYLRGMLSMSYRNGQQYQCDSTGFVLFNDISRFSNWIHDITTGFIQTSVNNLNVGVERPRTNQTEPSEEGGKFSDECGISSNVSQLIHGGKVFPKGQYPWIAPMFVKYGSFFQYQCVGNIISLRHILTAAHCLEHNTGSRGKIAAENIFFSFGLHDLSGYGEQEGSVVRSAKNYISHRDYKPGKADADLAIVHLKKTLKVTRLIRPLCLWPREFDNSLEMLVSTRGVVAGWGRNEAGKVSDIPKEVSGEVVSNEICEKETGLVRSISNRTFCAGDKNLEGPCNGDSGSAFIVYINSKWFLRGIVSLTIRNPTTFQCDLSSYVVYTDTAKFTNWIYETTLTLT